MRKDACRPQRLSLVDIGDSIAGRTPQDTAGRLPDQRVGVLLPDTKEAGAWKVASDVCEAYEIGHGRPDCAVFVYPDRPTDDALGRQEREEEPVASAGVSGTRDALDAFLAMETPVWKRGLDVVGATVGLIVSAPLIIAVAVAIKLTSRGPVFYVQEREGLAGGRFRMLKLRTMHANADLFKPALRGLSEQDGPAFKMSDDPRITWIGRWLRPASLDELPQFWNVLVGDMSLVGPRPLPTDESLRCSSWQRRRLHVKPGMTCIWQVHGRNTVSFDEWIRMDLQYVRQRSLWNDLCLLVQTLPSLFGQQGPR